MLHLLSVETLDSVVVHGAVIRISGLYESNHGLGALRIEVDIVSSANPIELLGSILKWVLTDCVFDIVPEVRNKSLTIF